LTTHIGVDLACCCVAPKCAQMAFAEISLWNTRQ
jgi:hypothetical protein